MADDETQRALQDAPSISLSEHYELRYWTQAAEELKRIVPQHGNSAAKVRPALGKRLGAVR